MQEAVTLSYLSSLVRHLEGLSVGGRPFLQMAPRSSHKVYDIFGVEYLVTIRLT